jgi:hypothetical protein
MLQWPPRASGRRRGASIDLLERRLYMERRNYPRLHTRFPAEVLAAGKRAIDHALATDVSITGLQLVCDERVANRIVDKAEKGKLKQAKPATIRVNLPLRDGTHVRVECRCKVRAVRKADDGSYSIGLEYEYFEGQSYAALEAFIDDWVEFPDET